MNKVAAKSINTIGINNTLATLIRIANGPPVAAQLASQALSRVKIIRVMKPETINMSIDRAMFKMTFLLFSFKNCCAIAPEKRSKVIRINQMIVNYSLVSS